MASVISIHRELENCCGAVVVMGHSSLGDKQQNWWSQTRDPSPKFKGSVKIAPPSCFLLLVPSICQDSAEQMA
jgi:hypothetical protein